MNKELLDQLISDLQFIQLEAALAFGATAMLLLGLLVRSSVVIRLLYVVVLGFAFYFNLQMVPDPSPVLAGSILITESNILFSSLFLVAGLLLLIFKSENGHSLESHFLVLSLILASVLMIKANSFLVLFLTVELASFVGYILSNFNFRPNSHEAAIKYLLFGAASSAIMLFGFGILYIDTGVFYLNDLPAALSLSSSFGLLLVVGGLLFKVSIVPYHIWVPAVYQSAPNDVVAILSTVPKIAGLILLGRLFQEVPSDHWLVSVVLVFGILTMMVGTFGAINQSHFRRMISFGAIAHSGFLLPLVLTNSDLAEQAFWYYALVYALMNYGVFYFIQEMESRDIHELSDYPQLEGSSILMTGSLTLLLVSLVGIPPMAGFTAKFLLFTTLWDQYLVNSVPLIVVYLSVAVFLTVASLFYYLRGPYQIFLKGKPSARTINFSVRTKLIATLFSIVLLLLFFVPEISTKMLQLLKATSP